MRASTARFQYHGTGGALLGLTLINAILSMLTLGIYSFWAKSRLRAFHYENTEADGDRFAYHGTGGELLRGALRAFGLILLLGFAFAVLMSILGGPEASPWTQGTITLGFYLLFAVLASAAVNLTRRYRLSRSSWRGVRFAFDGSTGDYMMMMARGTLLTIVTLGFYTPFFQSERRAFLVNHTRFGSEPFRYDGDGRQLFGDYVKAVLLTIPTLGLCWFWYAAHKHRILWSHTKMRGAQFISSVEGNDLLALHLTNFVLVVVTLGIATPWAITRMHAFQCEHLRLVGTVDWASIDQQAQAAGAMGEGLADGLDMDVGLGL